VNVAMKFETAIVEIMYKNRDVQRHHKPKFRDT